MSILGRVRELRRYPVKSLRGEQLDRVTVTPSGVEGDRRWALTDPSGGVLSARRVPAMLDARAVGEGADVRIELPSGRWVSAGSAEADEAVSGWLGSPVRLMQPTAGRPVIADEEGTYEGREGTFFDAAPIHLVTTGTLGDLSRRYTEGRFDPRRFRANLVVEVDGDDPVEQSWLGARLSIGSAVLSIVKPCRRCVMTTLAQEDLPRDKGILRTVAREAANTVGVYAIVDEPGRVSVGDAVRMLAQPS